MPIAALMEENSRLSAELQRAREEIRNLLQEATTDPLTGLLNRRGFLRLASEELSIARARSASLTLIYIDVDGLKKINDVYGHHEGDRLLMEAAELLRQAFRETDIVCRLGGDEFVVLTKGFRGDSTEITRRLDHVSDALHRAGMLSHRISLSAGAIVVDPCSSLEWQRVLNDADSEMYAVKKSRHAAFTSASTLQTVPHRMN